MPVKAGGWVVVVVGGGGVGRGGVGWGGGVCVAACAVLAAVDRLRRALPWYAQN